jgi:predicted GNAT family N-acyltransferase
VRVATGSWEALGADASRIRTSVFVEEQRIPADMEWDEADATALHAVAYNGLGQPLATGRLLTHAPGVAKIGRMAVHKVLRGTGVGRSVLDALLLAAAQRGDNEAMLHAQRSAQAFYASLGFVTRGEPFSEAGIPHIEMSRPVSRA